MFEKRKKKIARTSIGYCQNLADGKEMLKMLKVTKKKRISCEKLTI